MEARELLDWIGIMVPVIVVILQLFISHYYDKKNSDRLEKIENEKIENTFYQQRGLAYYNDAVSLINDVATHICLISELFVEDVRQINDSNSDFSNINAQRRITELQELLTLKGRMGCTLSNEILIQYTEYTTFISEQLTLYANNQWNFIDIKKVKHNEHLMLAQLRAEKMNITKNMFASRNYDIPNN